MRVLKDILYKVAIESVKGSTAVDIKKIHFDSRLISAQDVFVAIKGETADGHAFIETAVAKGANVIVCEEFPTELTPEVSYIHVKDCREALAVMASNYASSTYENYYETSRKYKTIMPDLTGYPAMDAVSILENLGLQVNLIGQGKVIKQSIKKGSKISNNQRINLISS